MRHPDVTTDHRKTTVDQFTRQADAFSSSPTMRDEKALRLIIDASGVSSDDTVLDVACGPGIVTCELAAVARRATGIDLTPAMIERARALQLEKKLSNITWHVGDVSQLPYGDQTFSSSFPKEMDGKEAVRTLFEESLADDGMALKPKVVDGEVQFSYPISILAATRT